MDAESNDANLREAGSYDPAAGKGLTTETDSGNFAGSLLLLAMLLPDTYGVEGADPLGIFGTPPPAGLVAVSSGCARSSVGVDNRRCNATMQRHAATMQQCPHRRPLELVAA